MAACLVPGLEVLALNAGDFFVGLSSNSPIKSADQVLTVPHGCEPVGTLWHSVASTVSHSSVLS